jgi:TPR repeat protein
MVLVFSAGLAIGLGGEAIKSVRSIVQQVLTDWAPGMPRSAASGPAWVAPKAYVTPIKDGNAGTPVDLEDLVATIDRQLENHEVERAVTTYRQAAEGLTNDVQLARIGERLSTAIWRLANQGGAGGQQAIAARHLELLKSLPPVPLAAVLDAVAPNREASTTPSLGVASSAKSLVGELPGGGLNQRGAAGTTNSDASNLGLSAPVVSEGMFMRHRGEQLLRLGDISAARRFFERAIALGDRDASTGLGKTYDPLFIAEIGSRGVAADPAMALQSYRSAAATGNEEAKTRMGSLLRAYADLR